MIEDISFNTFFIINKYRLKHDFVLMLNPDSQRFYRDKEIYYAVQFTSPDYVFIVTAVGHGLKESTHNFLIECKKWGYKKIRWGCQKESIMHKYAKLNNAILIEEIENAYNSGESAYIYEMEVKS